MDRAEEMLNNNNKLNLHTRADFNKGKCCVSKVFVKIWLMRSKIDIIEEMRNNNKMENPANTHTRD